MIGTSIGAYQITAKLGAGGMGEVYRARDTKLDREVAIKVLPAALAQHPDRLARFEREAKVLAALNHPNIAMIFGIEDRAIVMELVDGPTLADRIRSGAIPLEESLKIAAQIADALEAAHEKGIVHRDLKPANVKVRDDGTVKVLDFGLATAVQSTAGQPGDGVNSPTLTMGATEAGVILGTAAYMSPEQAAGKPVDRRADIWSFGVVLWEMLTGKRLFEGETVSHTLADVLRAPMDFEKLPKETPTTIRELLRRCLDRDIRTRLQWIGEARIAIQRWLANPSSGADVATSTPSPSPRKPLWLRWLWPSSAAIWFVVAGVFAGLWLLRPTPPMLTSRFTVDAPPNTAFTNPFAATAVSPDGRYLVFGAASGTITTSGPPLWLRPLDSLNARQLPGTEGANSPFWSPDSKSIAFFANDKLKRVEIVGGAPLVLCDAPQQSSAAVSGAWNRDGVILFGGHDGLHRVPASGGAPVLLTKVDASRQEAGHGYPQFLPDGIHFLYFVEGVNPDTQGIYGASLDRPQQPLQIVRTNVKAIYTPPVPGWPGYLLYLREQTLFAQRFDAGKLRLEGDPVPVAEDVSVNGLQRAAFWTSDRGLLVYRSGITLGKSRLLWKSRDGKVLGQPGSDDFYGALRLSPDGKRAAFGRSDGASSTSEDVWLFEFNRSVMTRLTFDSRGAGDPVWSADGRQIIFRSRQSGTYQLYRKDASGGGREEQLTKGPNLKATSDLSLDGRNLLYYELGHLWVLPLGGDGKPAPVLPNSRYEDSGQFSPDGKWIAYRSPESGRYEVYICAFPSSAGKWQVSNQGGGFPRWRGDGKELFYISSGNKMMAAGVRTSATSVETDTPYELFPVSFPGLGGGPGYTYDVTADGQRFLVLEAVGPGEGRPAQLTVVTNWQAGLRK